MISWHRTALGCILAAALGGCGSSVPHPERVAAARADLIDLDGATVGEAVFTEGDLEPGAVIRLRAWGLPPGDHALHIHATAKCDAPDFETAGEDFNPFGRKHGLQNPNGPHAGDLPNLHVPADGRVDAIFADRLLTLRPGPNSLLNPPGTSLVIHANPDDGKTDPAGNSGPRIACGPIRAAIPPELELR